MTQSIGRPVGETTYRKGLFILMVVNMFVKNLDYYPVTVKASIKLKEGKTYNAELLDFSSIVSIDDEQPMCFHIPLELQFNVSRTIRKNTDNVKCIAFMIEGIEFLELKDIDEITMVFNPGTISKKTVRIPHAHFPVLNATEILEKHKKKLEDKRNEELFQYISKTGETKSKGGLV